MRIVDFVLLATLLFAGLFYSGVLEGPIQYFKSEETGFQRFDCVIESSLEAWEEPEYHIILEVGTEKYLYAWYEAELEQWVFTDAYKGIVERVYKKVECSPQALEVIEHIQQLEQAKAEKEGK